jgi:uncharacterized membrane protein
MMTTINDSIEINVPVRTAYDQWTQFETFPRFMDGVKEVKQLDDRHLHWHAELWGKDVEWDSEITEQIPDRVIAWHSTNGPDNSGYVRFEPVADGKTRVDVQINYQPESMMQKAGDKLGAASSRLHDELENFKDFIESRGSETGAWRGTIE